MGRIWSGGGAARTYFWSPSWLSPPRCRASCAWPCCCRGKEEEGTVGKVISDFRTVLPPARVYVYDNGSTDHTAERRPGTQPTVGPRGNAKHRLPSLRYGQRT